MLFVDFVLLCGFSDHFVVLNGNPQLIILLYATANTCQQINQLNLVICFCYFIYINKSFIWFKPQVTLFFSVWNKWKVKMCFSVKIWSTFFNENISSYYFVYLNYFYWCIVLSLYVNDKVNQKESTKQYFELLWLLLMRRIK